MNFMNNTANIKQFQLIKFINENSNDDHVISKISIVLRRDKIEAPFYMITKIRLSSCVDNQDNGIIHAMDILNHQRMYNLTEDKYNEIKSLILDIDYDSEAKIFKKDKQLKLVLTSNGNINSFSSYHELLDKIDNLIE